MKKLLTATAMLLAGMAGAAAADLPVYKAPPPPPPVWSWTGFYIGANLGGGSASTSGSASLLTPGGVLLSGEGTTGNVTGIVGGGQIGYNWQFDHFVLGVEWDFDGTGQSTSASAACLGIIIAGPCTFNASAGVDWFSTLRGRLGWAADRWLFYVTGGVAEQRVSADLAATVPAGTFGLVSASADRSGYVVGLGVETAAWEHFILGAEYLYLNTGSIDNTFVLTAGNPFGLPAGSIIDTSRSSSNSIFRVRGSYKF